MDNLHFWILGGIAAVIAADWYIKKFKAQTAVYRNAFVSAKCDGCTDLEAAMVASTVLRIAKNANLV